MARAGRQAVGQVQQLELLDQVEQVDAQAVEAVRQEALARLLLDKHAAELRASAAVQHKWVRIS